jgi:hypothetical protein
MSTIPAPTPGRIVTYTDREGLDWPALVVAVGDLDAVDLTVYVHLSTTDALNVHYRATSTPGSWRWPTHSTDQLEVDDETGAVVGVLP